MLKPTIFEEQWNQLKLAVQHDMFTSLQAWIAAATGARRIAEDLKEMGHHCDRRKVSNVMKTLRLKAIQPKSFVPKTTNSRHRLGYSPNLLLDAVRTNNDQSNLGWRHHLHPADGRYVCYRRC
ncbi:MAG: hypothetical protein R3C20_14975 [Planctomycetaceae bacterium]